MPPTIEVVCQAQSEAATEVLLKGQVRLFRIGIHKTLADRITEGLERQRERRCRVQVILIDKNRLRKIQRLELLLIRQVSQVGREGSRDATGHSLNALENVGRVQIQWADSSRIRPARTASSEQQLAALGAVGGVTQEIKTEQRVIVEHAEGRT